MVKNFKNEAEVEQYHKESGDKVIIFEGTVYQVGEYMTGHPGGIDKIQGLLGKCIDEAFEDAGHTKSARLIFRDLEKVGYIVGSTDEGKATVKPTGLDGIELKSKIKLDYSKGLYG